MFKKIKFVHEQINYNYLKTNFSCLNSYLVFFVLLVNTNIAHAVLIDPVECNKPIPYQSVYTVLDESQNTLSGWSHVSVDNETFNQQLNLTAQEYKISKDNFLSDPACDGVKVQNAILVLKLGDWTQQHVNGFEAFIEEDNVLFSDISGVLVDFRINSDNSNIPSVQVLQETFGEYLNDDELLELDNGIASFGITLFEDGALDQSTFSFNADVIFNVDQTVFADQWLRAFIPIGEFRTYSQKNYSNTDVKLIDYPELIVKGFRLTAESFQGKQLRNFLDQEEWSEEIPEIFKQVSVSLRRIEFVNR